MNRNEGLCRGAAVLWLAVCWTAVGAIPVEASGWVAQPVSGVGSAVVAPDTSNIYVAGSLGNGSLANFVTMKYSKSGTLLWTRSYGGPGSGADGVAAMAVHPLGYVFVTGPSAGSGTSQDIATIRYAPSGLVSWTRRYDGPGHDWDEPTGIALDAGGNIYVCGASYDSLHLFDYTLLKYSLAGTLVWQRSYDGPGHRYDMATALAVSPTGDIVVTGFSCDTAGVGDYLTLAYNSAGDLLWEKRYDGDGHSEDWAHAVKVDGAGNAYVTGFSVGASGNADCTTLAYSSAGALLWVARFDGQGHGWDSGSSLALDPAGNCLVAGTTLAADSTYDYSILKYSPAGALLWDRTYGGRVSGWDEASGVAVDANSNVCVTGLSEGSGSAEDFLTLQYSPAGELRRMWVFNGPDNKVDASSAVALDGKGGIYLTGLGSETGGASLFTVIRVDSTSTSTAVADPEPTAVPPVFAVRSRGANPARTQFVLELDLPTAAVLDLDLYDVRGRRAAELLRDQALKAGSHRIPVGGERLPAGVYFYRVSGTLGGKRIATTGKLVLVR